MTLDQIIPALLATLMVLSIAACVLGIVIHIAWMISRLTDPRGVGATTVGQWTLAGLGLFFPPIGVVHGLMLSGTWLVSRTKPTNGAPLSPTLV
jgi:hypothetical protein